MDKAKYTKRLYKENINFKIYIDKLLADCHDYNKEPDIWENETVYQVGLYYEQLQKSGVAITNDPRVAKELYCSCEQEDKKDEEKKEKAGGSELHWKKQRAGSDSSESTV